MDCWNLNDFCDPSGLWAQGAEPGIRRCGVSGPTFWLEVMMVSEQPIRATHEDDTDSTWVIHVPIEAKGLRAALVLAEYIAGVLAPASHVMAREISVSPEDDQAQQIAVWCNRPIQGRAQRCGKKAHHAGRCGPGNQRAY